jgi:CO/xanthine dehydrogenase FAD-binding subunit
MHQLTGYHRPTSIEEVTRLLDGSRLVIAGGTTIRHDGGADPVEVVDLQSLGLDSVSVVGNRVGLGAMVTLQALVDNDNVPDLIRRTARSELPSTLRTLATVGGTIVAGGSESVLLAALLVQDGFVRFADGRFVSLATVLESGIETGDLIVGVELATDGRTAMAVTGRTPADSPIVAIVGRVAPDGIRLAATGLGPTPRVVDPDAVDDIQPPGDFRGGSAYRKHLAEVLSDRVRKELS